MFTATGVMIYIRGLRTSRGREIHSLNPPQNATCIKIAPQTPYPQYIKPRSQFGLSMKRYTEYSRQNPFLKSGTPGA